MTDATILPDVDGVPATSWTDQEVAGVCIYNINRGDVTSVYSASIAHLMYMDGCGPKLIRGYLQRAGTSSPSITRSAGVQHFLNETNGEWMHWADSDLEFGYDALVTQMEVCHPVDAPIVCGLYISALPEGLVPVAWDLNNKVLDPEWTAAEIAKGTRLVECSRVGAGWLTIHRDVLLKMYAESPIDPWFGEDITEGVKEGEDFTFCRRAARVGYKIHVDLGADLSHHKTIAFHKRMLGNVQIETRVAGSTDPIVTPPQSTPTLEGAPS